MIDKREKTGLKNLNDPTAFIEYSSTMDDILENIEDYNKKRKRKILIVFDDMTSHVMSDKKAQQVLKELFIRCRKLKHFTLSFKSVLFQYSKRCKIKLYSLHYF